jgi:hypothetical protein
MPLGSHAHPQPAVRTPTILEEVRSIDPDSLAHGGQDIIHPVMPGLSSRKLFLRKGDSARNGLSSSVEGHHTFELSVVCSGS